MTIVSSAHFSFKFLYYICFNTKLYLYKEKWMNIKVTSKITAAWESMQNRKSFYKSFFFFLRFVNAYSSSKWILLHRSNRFQELEAWD